MKNERKYRSILLLVGIGLILGPPLITLPILEWLQSRISIGFIFGVLLVLLIVGVILILVSFIKSTVQGIQNVKAKWTYAAFEILIIAIVPFLIYWAINPSINDSSVSKTDFANNLLIVSTVLLGFTMVVGGIRQRIPPEELINELDNNMLTFAKYCQILALFIGFNTIVWILRWFVVNSDQLMNSVIGLFSFQIPLTFVSSYAYLYSRIFYPDKPKISA